MLEGKTQKEQKWGQTLIVKIENKPGGIWGQPGLTPNPATTKPLRKTSFKRINHVKKYIIISVYISMQSTIFDGNNTVYQRRNHY